MAKAIQAAVTAVGADNQSVLLDASEIETIEQLGRDVQVAEDGKAQAERKLGQCDVALFDILNGRDYAFFKAVSAAFINGMRDKGCPTDDAAERAFQRAVKRIETSCSYVKPKAETKAAKAMSEKRAKALAELQAKTDNQLEIELSAAVEAGTVESLRKAQALAQEKARRDKPVLDAEATARKAVLDKLLERAKELAKAKTSDADAKLQAALLALS